MNVRKTVYRGETGPVKTTVKSRHQVLTSVETVKVQLSKAPRLLMRISMNSIIYIFVKEEM